MESMLDWDGMGVSVCGDMYNLLMAGKSKDLSKTISNAAQGEDIILIWTDPSCCPVDVASPITWTVLFLLFRYVCTMPRVEITISKPIMSSMPAKES